VIGQRFNMLEVIAEAPRPQGVRNKRWECRCDCGQTTIKEQTNLRSGQSFDCGCTRGARISASKTVHGHKSRRGASPEYEAWTHARARCTNPKNADWPDYGGRGIRMAPAFIASFEAYLAEVGPRPGPGYTIDRRDVNGHYEPGNLRWATSAQQGQNRRDSKLNSAQVAEIRALRGKLKGYVIAQRYGVTPAMVSAIQLRQAWRAEA
jgi:hypothetical protein